MSKVLLWTVTRADTPERGKLLTNTLVEGAKHADHDFTWVLWTTRGTIGEQVAETARSTGILRDVYVWPHNKGQHVATNIAHQMAIDGNYDYVIRVDDDVEWPTKRWLRKLVDASKKLGDKFVLAPKVRGLRFQPSVSQLVEAEGVPLYILYDAVGGICRLIPTALLKEHPYTSDVRKPMGTGDATGIGAWCKKEVIMMAYLKNVRVKHARTTPIQEREDPEYHFMHDICHNVPYLPPHKEVLI